MSDPLANDPRLLPPQRITDAQWERARQIALTSTHENLTREDIATMIWAEYLYWREVEIDDNPMSTFALGPVANLTGALFMGRPPTVETPATVWLRCSVYPDSHQLSETADRHEGDKCPFAIPPTAQLCSGSLKRADEGRPDGENERT